MCPPPVPVPPGPLHTLAVFGEDTGGYATDILAADAAIAHLGPEQWQGDHLHVAQVGEHGQVVLPIILSPAAAKVGHAHAPHPGALQGRELQLQLGAHLGQCEDLVVVVGAPGPG